jgi:hypothetical protein
MFLHVSKPTSYSSEYSLIVCMWVLSVYVWKYVEHVRIYIHTPSFYATTRKLCDL